MTKPTTINRFVLLFAVVLSVCLPWATGCASLQAETTQLASRVRGAVVQEDKAEFKDFFSDSSDLSEDDWIHYFGNEKKPSPLRDFMTRASIKARIFEGASSGAKRSVTIVYYDSISATEPVTLDWKSIGDGWLKKYTAVDLIQVDGKWYFDNTPFFFFRHAPWAGDYG